jgi:hypothetical protein
VGGAGEVVLLVISWAQLTGMIFAVVIGDERDLPAEQAERAWPAVSRNAAIVAFGILAVPIHFARTRGDFKSIRGALGVLLGLVVGLGCAAGMGVLLELELSVLLPALGVDLPR